MMNRYEDALNEFRIVSLTEGDDRVVTKYRSKALDNTAIVKCMAGNFKEAFNICESVEIDSLSFLDRMKHQIKYASVLKKSSSYRQGLAILEKIEAEVTEELEKK